MVTCERCGAEDLSLVEDLPDGRKLVRCDNCGHQWPRGQPTTQKRPEPETPASSEDRIPFIDDDEGYETWLRRNTAGYVINCNRTPSPDYLILHYADCYTISEPPPRGTTWTTGDYIKVCSRSRPALQEWAKERTGSEASLCGACFG